MWCPIHVDSLLSRNIFQPGLYSPANWVLWWPNFRTGEWTANSDPALLHAVFHRWKIRGSCLLRAYRHSGCRKALRAFLQGSRGSHHRRFSSRYPTWVSVSSGHWFLLKDCLPTVVLSSKRFCLYSRFIKCPLISNYYATFKAIL